MIKVREKYQSIAAVEYQDDPLLLERERTGQWIGVGAELFGVSTDQPVQTNEFRMLLEGMTPSGQSMYQRRRNNRRCAWDYVFTSSKSVSIAALCIDASLRKTISQTWNQAVNSTMSLMSKLIARRGYQRDGRNIDLPSPICIAARYTHENSRYGDPHLHSHLVLINATYDLNHKQWYAIQPSFTYKSINTINTLFQRELSLQLNTNGVRARFNGDRAEIIGIPQNVQEEYSKGHNAIDEHARAPRPRKFRNLNTNAYRNQVNDKIRPPRKKTVEFLDRVFDTATKDLLLKEIETKRTKLIVPKNEITELQKNLNNSISSLKISTPKKRLDSFSRTLELSPRMPLSTALNQLGSIAPNKSRTAHKSNSNRRINAYALQQMLNKAPTKTIKTTPRSSAAVVRQMLSKPQSAKFRNRR